MSCIIMFDNFYFLAKFFDCFAFKTICRTFAKVQSSAGKLCHFHVMHKLIAEQNMLLSDEFVHDMKMTKFPGGGLYFGEGPADCLKREAIEEFGQEIEIVEHYYTTHFFQQALFY